MQSLIQKGGFFMKKAISIVMLFCLVLAIAPAAAFAADPAPEYEYTILDKMTSDGSFYVPTGVIPDTNTAVEYKIKWTVLDNNYRSFCASKHNQEDGKNAFLLSFTKGSTWFAFGESNRDSTSSIKTDTEYVIRQDNAGITINGTQENYPKSPAELTGENQFLLFTQNTGQNDVKNRTFIGEFYYCKIWDGDTLIHHYVPAMRSDGMLMLKDLVTNSYLNTVDATSGPDTASMSPIEKTVTLNNDAIIAANATVGADLTVNYYVDKSIGTDVTMSFTRNGKITSIDTCTEAIIQDKEGDDIAVYIFSYPGINSQCMTDPVDAVVYVDGQAKAMKTGITIAGLYDDISNRNGITNTIKDFINATLVYGGASQQFINYIRTNLPRTIGYIDYTAQSGIPSDSVKSIGEKNFDADNNIMAGFTGFNLYLANTIKIKFQFAFNYPSTDGWTLKLYKDYGTASQNVIGTYSGEDLRNGYIYTRGLYPTEFDSTFTAVLQYYTTPGNPNPYKKCVASYNVNSYCISKWNSDNQDLSNLVKAIYDYGKTASLLQ